MRNFAACLFVMTLIGVPFSSVESAEPAAPAQQRLSAEDLVQQPGSSSLTGPGVLSNEHLALSREDLLNKHVIAALPQRRDRRASNEPRDTEAEVVRLSAESDVGSDEGEVWLSVNEDRPSETEEDPWLALVPGTLSGQGQGQGDDREPTDRSEPISENIEMRDARLPTLTMPSEPADVTQPGGEPERGGEPDRGGEPERGRELESSLANDPAMADYDECVEVSVRRGNGLRESMRVCASLHL